MYNHENDKFDDEDRFSKWGSFQEKIISKYLTVDDANPSALEINTISFSPQDLKEMDLRGNEPVGQAFFKVKTTAPLGNEDLAQYVMGIDGEIDQILHEIIRVEAQAKSFNRPAQVNNMMTLYSMCKERLGCDHHNTIAVLQKLRTLMDNDSSALFVDLTLYKHYATAYGNDRFITLYTISCIAADLSHNKNDEDACILSQYVHCRCLKQYGTNSEANIWSLNGLMRRFHMSERYADALACAELALEIAKNLYEPGDHHLLHTMMGVSFVCRNNTNPDYNRALEIDTEVLNTMLEKSSDEQYLRRIPMARENLAQDYFRLEYYSEAEKIQALVVEDLKKTWGSEHPITLIALSNHSAMLSRIDEWDRALEIDRTVAELWERQRGPLNHHTLRSQNAYIISLANAGHKEEAMEQAYSYYEKRYDALGENDENTRTSLQQYLDLRDGKWPSR